METSSKLIKDKISRRGRPRGGLDLKLGDESLHMTMNDMLKMEKLKRRIQLSHKKN